MIAITTSISTSVKPERTPSRREGKSAMVETPQTRREETRRPTCVSFYRPSAATKVLSAKKPCGLRLLELSFERNHVGADVFEVRVQLQRPAKTLERPEHVAQIQVALSH